MCPGGEDVALDLVIPLLEKVAAKDAKGRPCVGRAGMVSDLLYSSRRYFRVIILFVVSKYADARSVDRGVLDIMSR